MRYRTFESGRSMVEMMGYMAVAMTLIVAVGRIVSNAFEEHRYSVASVQLGDLAAAISAAGAMETDYSAVVNNVKSYVPTSFRVAGNNIYHTFGGKVIVSVPGTDKDKFAIEYKGLRRKQCIELGMKSWERNRNVDLYGIIVNGSGYYWPVYKSGVSDTYKLPMTRARLTGTSDGDNGACDKASDNEITWIFN